MAPLNIPQLLRSIDLQKVDPEILVRCKEAQHWLRRNEIDKALDNSDAVIVTLSTGSVSKEGYVQKELRFVLDIALEKPDGTIFILPLRLDDCLGAVRHVELVVNLAVVPFDGSNRDD